MPVTYEPLVTTTLTATATTISFTSISGSYTDLRLVLFAGTGLSADCRFVFNSATTGFSSVMIKGDGTSATAVRTVNQATINPLPITSASPNFTLITVDIFDYAGATNKTCLVSSSSDANGSGETVTGVAMWRNTSAVTSVTFSLSRNNFVTGTTASLYGILKA